MYESERHTLTNALFFFFLFCYFYSYYLSIYEEAVSKEWMNEKEIKVEQGDYRFATKIHITFYFKYLYSWMWTSKLFWLEFTSEMKIRAGDDRIFSWFDVFFAAIFQVGIFFSLCVECS